MRTGDIESTLTCSIQKLRRLKEIKFIKINLSVYLNVIFYFERNVVKNSYYLIIQNLTYIVFIKEAFLVQVFLVQDFIF